MVSANKTTADTTVLDHPRSFLNGAPTIEKYDVGASTLPSSVAATAGGEEPRRSLTPGAFL